ncbi:MAG TPA: methyltransferase domain-containing protein [Ktedonobacteraceae bacterium]|nr:methyltransferase domain-containing protein [Ktedonobacteraceae bacterium]
MAVDKLDNLVYGNECGLPLNAITWLETHHTSKLAERSQMIRDLLLKPGSLIIDAGCGPGLWTPLLAQAIGAYGHIVGVDISQEALITAQKRSYGKEYRHQVQYKYATMEDLPLAHGTADAIFSANVSQYLAHPVSTFHAMGRYLKDGGRLIIKDIDFGTMRFHNIDSGLQARVFQAREQWERVRVAEGFAFEDSWVGSKLATYLREAGYEDVQEKSYLICRHYSLPAAFRTYLQGIAEWFVCEGAPFLESPDVTRWLQCFLDETHNVLDQETFVSEETEYVVSGVWNKRSTAPLYILQDEQTPLLAEAVLQ